MPPWCYWPPSLYDALSLKAAIDRAYQDLPTAAEEKWRRFTRRKHKHLVEGEW